MKTFFLRHLTTYRYSNNVAESNNKIHLYPYNDLNQQIVTHKITVSGSPVISTYIDDYNNRVGSFSYLPPHNFLSILSEAEINKNRLIMPEDTMDIKSQWSNLNELKNSIEFLPFLEIDFFPKINEAKKIVNALKSETNSPFRLANNLCEFINKEFKYKKGVTNIYTKIQEVWNSKTGVCQDFTNILIQLCRIASIPSRYVSGYVFATGRLRGASATHAWVEVYLPYYGWIGLDPTNNCIADIYHIKLCVGRNYNDCSPVKGVYKGNETQIMDVEVELDTKKIKSKSYDYNGENMIRKEKENIDVNSFQKNLQMIQQQQQ
tara:strand:+ start:1210 stop:2169 length:960 start_codon:yes stop_codon:yes gene_type:complete